MKIWVIQNEGGDRVNQNKMTIEGENEEESKKDEKLEIHLHKDVIKQVSFIISLNMYKY